MLGSASPQSPQRARFARRLLAAVVALTIFFLLDLGLFGWLVARSLSERELERALLETRREVEDLAERIATSATARGKDLFTTLAHETETQTYIDSILRQRDIVRTVEVKDRDGVLVYRSFAEETIPVGRAGLATGDGREFPPQVTTQSVETQSTYESEDLSIPIGELGYLNVGLSRSGLERRIEAVRQDLVRQIGWIAVVTVAVFALAYLTIWSLWLRGRRLEDHAAENERMAYLGTFASGLAHEIRNPLNSLSLSMQLLEEEIAAKEPSEPDSQLLAITRSELGRLERLVTDFLSYAKPRPLQAQVVSAVELLRGCLQVLQSEVDAYRAGVRVVDDTGGSLISVDTEQVRQLVLNLLQNSLAATASTPRQPRIQLSVRRRSGRLSLEVQDNGCGIPTAEQGSVFDLFYSTRDGGTGLGLAIAKRIAEAHGAELEVESKADEGTTVRMLLPPEREVAAQPATESGQRRDRQPTASVA